MRQHRSKAVAFATSLVVILISTTGSGQTVHSVRPDTRGNTIELAVVNASATSVSEDIVISLARSASHLSFASVADSIRFIEPGKEAVARFVFTVARNAPINMRDTVEFRISDKAGLELTKRIIVQYQGPTTFALDQNFPNPFNPTTTIHYQLPTDSRVSLMIYDLLGREVATLIDATEEAGFKSVQWDARQSASGTYFCRINASPVSGAATFHGVKKMLVVK